MLGDVITGWRENHRPLPGKVHLDGMDWHQLALLQLRHTVLAGSNRKIWQECGAISSHRRQHHTRAHEQAKELAAAFAAVLQRRRGQVLLAADGLGCEPLIHQESGSLAAEAVAANEQVTGDQKLP